MSSDAITKSAKTLVQGTSTPAEAGGRGAPRLHRILTVVGILFVAVLVRSQQAGTSIGKHDLNGASCATCHAERASAPLSPAQAMSCDKSALWDCELTSRTFLTYDSPLPAADAEDTAAAGDATQVRPSSLLCVSCHDGVFTKTMNVVKAFPTAGSLNSQGLRFDHPIDIPHDPAKNLSLAALPLVTKQVKLFGQKNNVQCTTCHEVHEERNSYLLRLSDKNSTLCVACHL
jgi:predicted CXXCH cytochrome family protein